MDMVQSGLTSIPRCPQHGPKFMRSRKGNGFGQWWSCGICDFKRWIEREFLELGEAIDQ